MPQTPLDKACLVVQQEIDKARSRSQTRLPSILHLARTAGVAHETMRKAVARFRQEKKLEAKRSAGITIRGDSTESQAGPAFVDPKLRWQRLKTELYQDLVDGAFGHRNPLPSRKELSSRYAVASKTLDKALRALHASGVLVPHKKSYLLAYTLPRARQDTIILFARGATRGQLGRFNPRTSEYYYAIEKACLAHSVQLQVVRCYTVYSKFVFDEYNQDGFTDAVDLKRVLGFVIWQIALDRTFPLWLTEWVARFAKPVAYYFDIHDGDTVLPSAERGPVRCFGVESNFEAGRRTGHYLLARGHKRIACFCSRPGQQWQSERLDGLCSAYAQGGVVLRRGVDIAEVDAGARFEATRLFSLLEREEQVKYRRDSAAELYFTIYRHVAGERVNQALVPLMEETARDRSITAWVGINDDIALECSRFLLASGIHVPNAVSIIGFDNSYDAASLQLSSYDFNGAGAMRAMVDFVLRPRTSAAARPSGGPLLLKGFVHERMSTRAVAGGR
jgi:DNA-binding LacI/PurR family transcriptional regulator